MRRSRRPHQRSIPSRGLPRERRHALVARTVSMHRALSPRDLFSVLAVPPPSGQALHLEGRGAQRVDPSVESLEEIPPVLV